MLDVILFLMRCRITTRVLVICYKMGTTVITIEDVKQLEEKEEKEESILAMLGIVGTILNLFVIVFVYIHTTL
ncbi:hypothetical protein HHUSO_G6884 [Huso huso]|uniref:Uncharacterized protein n=2 Tax=Acipenseridae TaxID=7900 RepID=A0AAD8GC72_ACIOX|nr:hypothetical protein AOXY_G6604 [Acipenser oxyrinchus oxyrinchus]